MKTSKKKAESEDPLDRDLSDLLLVNKWKTVRLGIKKEYDFSKGVRGKFYRGKKRPS